MLMNSSQTQILSLGTTCLYSLTSEIVGIFKMKEQFFHENNFFVSDYVLVDYTTNLVIGPF